MALALQAVVSLNTSRFARGMGRIRQQAVGAASALAVSFGGVTGEILAMTRAFGPLGGAIATLRSVISVGVTFEQQMAEVAAVTNLAAREMTAVKEAAREFAAETAFTATQAGEALVALGRAGIATASALESTLAPALKLAGATAGETQTATEILTSSMAQFRKGAGEASSVADILAAATVKSPLNLERLSDAMAQAGSVGAAFGLTLEDTIAAVAGFSKAGINGSQAGTRFRQAMLTLSSAALEADGAIGKALTDWVPATEGLAGAVARLEAAGLTGQDAMTELGRKGGLAVASQMGLGSKALKQLRSDIIAAADVSRIYAKQTNTLGKQFAIFVSQVQEVALKLFDLLEPAFRAAVKIMQRVARWVNNLVELLGKRDLKSAWGEIADAAAKAWSRVVEASKVIQPAIDRIREVAARLVAWWQGIPDLAKVFVVIVPILAALSVGIQALIPIVVAFFTTFIVGAIKAGVTFVTTFLVPILLALEVVAAAFIAFSMGEVIAKVRIGSNTVSGHLTDLFTSIGFGFERMKSEGPLAWKEFMLEIKERTLSGVKFIVEAFVKGLGGILDSVLDFGAFLADSLGLDELADKMFESTKGMREALNEFDSGIDLEGVRGELDKVRGELGKVRDGWDEAWGLTQQDMVKGAKENLEDAVEVANFFPAVFEQTGANGTKAWELITNGAKQGVESIKGALAKVVGLGAGLLTTGKDGKDSLDDVGDAAGDAGDKVDDLDEAAKRARGSLVGLETKIGINIELPNITRRLGKLWEAFFKVLRRNQDIDVDVDVKIPKITRSLAKIWEALFIVFRKNKDLDIKIDVQIPRVTRSLARIWEGLFTVFRRNKDVDIGIDIDLPKLTNKQVKLWEKFFAIIRGGGAADVPDVPNIQNFGADIKRLADGVQKLVAMKGIIWR